MSESTPLLNSKQMAQFVASGFLRFDGIVPAETNAEAMREIDAGIFNARPTRPGVAFDSMWADSPGIGEVFRLPQVRGIIQSLVGPAPLYDHHAVHVIGGGHPTGQTWHADAIIDTRLAFDVQLMYFAHETPREMGGTMVLPGSHLRRVNDSDIAGYHNFRGQMAMACPAGSFLAVHHGIWHCGQPNRTERTRYMFKVRLNPTVRQARLWDTSDLHDPQVAAHLRTDHRWYGNEIRLEFVNRIKLWRYLLDDETFDLDYWMARLENQAQVA